MNIIYYDEAASTNDEAKRLMREGKAGPGDIIEARRQSAGRGRGGSSFFSPGGGSVYVSYILKPTENPAEQRVTVFAAVAVCHTIEKTTSYKPAIKGINDVLVGGRKVCGILAESIKQGVVLGIGVNINLNENDFPDEIKEIAGSLQLDEETRALFKKALTEEVFRCMDIADKPDTDVAAALMDEYKARCVHSS